MHDSFGLQSATIAMTGAVLGIVICKVDPEEAMKEIDLNTLLFFMGLFVLVGGVEATGIIEEVAKKKC